MGGHRRIKSSLNCYHIIVKADPIEGTFTEPFFEKLYLDLITDKSRAWDIEILAYAMLSHYCHFLIQGDLDDLACFFRLINSSFAMKYNFNKKRSGSVFQGRFKSQPVDNVQDMLKTLRYIHNIHLGSKDLKSTSFKAYTCEKPPSSSPSSRFRSIINSSGKKYILKFFNNSLEEFLNFHNSDDENLYLDIKEARTRRLNDLAIKIIENSQNKQDLEGLINLLLEKLPLSHRQIANYLKIDINKVHRVSIRA